MAVALTDMDLLCLHTAGLPSGAAAAARIRTDTNGPLCVNVSAPFKAALSLVPAPPADQLCPTLLDSYINTCACQSACRACCGAPLGPAAAALSCNPTVGSHLPHHGKAPPITKR